MRLLLFATLFFLISCAGRTPVRGIASIESDFYYGSVNQQKSSVKLFPPKIEKGVYRYFFYLQLKNSEGHFVDCYPVDISIKSKKGKRPQFTIERLLRGRYYVSIEATSKLAHEELDFVVSGKPLKEQFKLLLKQPDIERSWIRKISAEKNKLRLKLFLGDSKGKPVEIPSPPEFIIEGQALIENLEHVGEGHWELDLTFPERNEIIYLSVRAQGTYLERIFRFQHVEK